MLVAFTPPTPPGREPTKLSRYRSPRLHFVHHTEIIQANDAVTVDGILNNDGLVVALRSPDHRCTFREQSCVRFSPQELPKISGAPDHTNRFCDVSPGETSEGLAVVIESHRCYAADSQGNTPTLKARSNIHFTFGISLTVRMQRFYRHALVCSSLSHANIVPFLGIFSSNKFPYACVFESIGKGNLAQYLVSNPGAPRLKLVRNHTSFCRSSYANLVTSGHQLMEVARGLHHIHDLNIVHGSIRGVRTFRPQWPFRTHYSSRQTSASVTAALPELQDSPPRPLSYSPALR